MKVKILVEFEVISDEAFTPNQAKSAASIAAYDHLELAEQGGWGSPTGAVDVYVEGLGPVSVQLGSDHD